MLKLAALLLLSATMANATDCALSTPYASGLCHYRTGDLNEAARIFEEIAIKGEQTPETIRSNYFLGRTLMKQKRWKEASNQFIRIYALSPTFYNEWACDFLLGEARSASGEP